MSRDTTQSLFLGWSVTLSRLILEIEQSKEIIKQSQNDKRIANFCFWIERRPKTNKHQPEEYKLQNY
jgi:hypothetical protein